MRKTRLSLPNAHDELLSHAPYISSRLEHSLPSATSRAGRPEPRRGDMASRRRRPECNRNICVCIPYSFGTANLRKRKPDVKLRVVLDAKITYLYHASFETRPLPFLVCGMVWTLPPFRRKSIEAARKQCTHTCGLERQ